LKIEYRKKFLKELAKIPSQIRSNIEFYVFEVIPNLNSINDANKIEKLKGYKSCFKIRFGEYRVGLKSEDEVIILERVLHRKDIYKYFP
jgi:mRNA interferase RelE/StbE